MKQTNSPDDLLLALELPSGRGVRSALEAALRRGIAEGRLAEGTTLPPSRTLSRELGVSRSVVVGAYEQLVAEGYLEARQGSATRVRLATSRADDAAPPLGARAERPPVASFRGGVPDPSLFPRRAWTRHHRAALRDLPDAHLGYPDPQGAPELRAALTRHLGMARGVVTAPERVHVYGGFTQALALLCRALRRDGVTRLGVEEPCFGFHRRVVMNAGLEPVPLALDDGGIDVGDLRRSGVRAVLLAPAHSYPLGAVLAPDRRVALLDWARSTDGLVIEDDYDAEFRYDRAPVGSLHGLAPEHVVYGGGVAKTLSPALRLGWLVAPERLTRAVRREKLLDDMANPILDQLALARFIDAGDFVRHLRRMRPTYRARRDAALRALAEHLPDARPRGIAAGLHVYVELPRGTDEARLVARAADRGVDVEGAAWHWHRAREAPPGLVLGYGATGEAAIERGIALLGKAFRG